MKRIISALAIAIGIVPLSAAPSFADPSVPTYVITRGMFINDSDTAAMAASLRSADQRCVLNRKVTFREYQVDNTWVTLGSDTTVSTEVAAIQAPLTTGVVSMTSPARTLPDGTVCEALTALPTPTARVAVTNSSADLRLAGSSVVFVEYNYSFGSRIIAHGYLDVPKKCRGNRIVRIFRTSEFGYVPTGRDITGRSGVWGIGGEHGIDNPDSLKVSLVKKKLSDGTVCAGETYTVGGI